ncbi:MAG: PTS fructose transporter subunit IIA [Desulfobacteraceae bacterium]|nr:PTS fructose transporter subunit IIA [Desulfobacteraceae bacterium]MCB9494889.1 PTS fructose transporter subunit IIA [Desulfobacteraceae bacterium]
MIGIIVVTHGNLGKALIETAEMITGAKIENCIDVSINVNENADGLRDKIKKAIKKAANEDGIIILTDMFGGTPSNLSYSFLEEGKTEVLSGINLPVLIRATELRKKLTLPEVAQRIETFGKKSISLASGILKGNPRSA